MTPLVIVLQTLIAFNAAPASPSGDMFDDADANGDGVLTCEELTAVLPEATCAEFEKADLNHDGKLEYDEFELAVTEGYFGRP